MRLGLCSVCRGRLRPPAPGCNRCGRPLSGAALPEGGCCGRCRSRPPALARLSAAFSYEPPLDAALRAFKFARLDYLGCHVAEEILGRCRDHLGEFDAVVPVPLHWWRRWRRGFNQAELDRPAAGSDARPSLPPGALPPARHAAPGRAAAGRALGQPPSRLPRRHAGSDRRPAPAAGRRRGHHRRDSRGRGACPARCRRLGGGGRGRRPYARDGPATGAEAGRVRPRPATGPETTEPGGSSLRTGTALEDLMEPNEKV